MFNIKHTISRAMTVVTGTATFVTLYSWHQSINESLFVRNRFYQFLLEKKNYKNK